MKAPVRNFIIRDAGGIREAETLVLGQGVPLTTTAGGLPEIESFHVGEVQLMPSGGNDTQAIHDALATGKDVRLGPGSFTITESLWLGAGGTGQRLIGSGASRTLVTGPSQGAAVFIESGHCAVEGLHLKGFGNNNTFGIRAVVSPGPLTLRDLFIQDYATGIHLENASACDIVGVKILLGNLHGIYASGLSRGMLRKVEVIGVSSDGIHIENCTDIVCEEIAVREVGGYGISMSGGTGYRLSTVHTYSCDHSLSFLNVATLVMEAVVVTDGAESGIRLIGARDVALNGYLARSTLRALFISGSENVVVGAFRSDTSSNTPQQSHLVVANSSGVSFTGARVVNGATPPTYEVDVSGAGGRVVFIQHNFDPARINSGGNFAAL